MRRSTLFLSSLLVLSVGVTLCGQGRSQDDRPRFRTAVEQVVVYTSVYNREGALVSDLEKEDFRLFEDKVEQSITSLVKIDIPSSIGIVLDTSGSMKAKMPLVEQAIDLFLSLNNPENELFLIRFDDEVELEENFTRDPEDIRDAMRNLLIKGGTSLFDAIYLSVDKAEQGEEPRKVVVVFTDGEDKDSYYTQPQLLDKVRESESQVFIVAFLDKDLSSDRGFFGMFKSKRDKVESELEQIADVTGGKAYFPQKIDELSAIFRQIAQELKQQYQLGYISTNDKKDGAWREIDVRVRSAEERRLVVRARKGYYAPQGS